MSRETEDGDFNRNGGADSADDAKEEVRARGEPRNNEDEGTAPGGNPPVITIDLGARRMKRPRSRSPPQRARNEAVKRRRDINPHASCYRETQPRPAVHANEGTVGAFGRPAFDPSGDIFLVPDTDSDATASDSSSEETEPIVVNSVEQAREWLQTLESEHFIFHLKTPRQPSPPDHYDVTLQLTPKGRARLASSNANMQIIRDRENDGTVPNLLIVRIRFGGDSERELTVERAQNVGAVTSFYCFLEKIFSLTDQERSGAFESINPVISRYREALPGSPEYRLHILLALFEHINNIELGETQPEMVRGDEVLDAGQEGHSDHEDDDGVPYFLPEAIYW